MKALIIDDDDGTSTPGRGVFERWLFTPVHGRVIKYIYLIPFLFVFTQFISIFLYYK